jgi:hypothetical protein
VIFKLDGGDVFGVLSIVSSYPFPNVASGASGAIAAATAVLVKNDLLEFDMVLRFSAFKKLCFDK